jgi:hypothetical protein
MVSAGLFFLLCTHGFSDTALAECEKKLPIYPFNSGFNSNPHAASTDATDKDIEAPSQPPQPLADPTTVTSSLFSPPEITISNAFFSSLLGR